MATDTTPKSRWEALQQRLTQTVETVTRSARIDIVGGNIDEIDPPDGLDEYWEQYQTTGIVRSNLNQFISDVVRPGVRVDADDDATQAYFMGGDDAPDSAPEGGFLSQSFVYAGERHQPFLPGLKTTVANRWVRGTALVELLKADRADPESPITGFYHIRPETVYPQVEANRNILLPPDPDALPATISEDDVTFTPRGEVAAYIQFDDQSILGRRYGGLDEDDIPLSQNDVMKQVLDPDIGGSTADESGIFGTSVLEAIDVDIEEYKATKRDRYRAIQTKAYGIWLANFQKEVLDLGAEKEIVEWSDGSQDDFMDVLGDLGPGDVMEADGPFDLEQFDSDVPDLEGTLDHYVDDITAPLPAPKYSVGFEKGINQFVTERQEVRYEEVVEEERRYQERSWTRVFRTIAERHPDLDPSGVTVLLQPEEETSPVLSLTDDEMERIEAYASALKALYGPGGAPSYVDDETLLGLVLQLPEDAIQAEPDAGSAVDESDPEVQAQLDELRAAVNADGDGAGDGDGGKEGDDDE